jgi:hypothetical protein
MADTQASFSFHRSIYSPEGVKAALDAYGGYAAAVDVEEGAQEIVVTLKGYDEGYGDAFGDSFANHALFETIVRARQALGG